MIISAPQTSCRITSPIYTGAATDVLRRHAITVIIESLDTGVLVFTLTMVLSRLDTRTVAVTVRTGLVHSLMAYSSPLGHALPVTFAPLDVICAQTVQPRGQMIQVNVRRKRTLFRRIPEHTDTPEPPRKAFRSLRSDFVQDNRCLRQG